MMEQKKTGKQIVSKREFLFITGKRVGYSLATAAWIVIGFVGVVYYATWMFTHLKTESWNTLCIGFGCLVFMLVLSIAFARAEWKEVQALRNIEPFTRSNTIDLPAQNSLVRASQEPAQAQQFVLLRAAAEGSQTPAEEMLRASVGGVTL